MEKCKKEKEKKGRELVFTQLGEIKTEIR